jgi:hypothetical protein
VCAWINQPFYRRDGTLCKNRLKPTHFRLLPK